jgi:hypothetical protein
VSKRTQRDHAADAPSERCADLVDAGDERVALPREGARAQNAYADAVLALNGRA